MRRVAPQSDTALGAATPTCHNRPNGRVVKMNRPLDWLPDVRRVHSPNCDPRPPGYRIELIVLHGISLPAGRFGSGLIEALFCNTLDCSVHADLADLAGVRVSAHLLIERSGRITQFVPFSMRAWHAGVSRWRGREGCNDFSIGIELEGTDHVPYSEAQYAALERVLGFLYERFALGPERVAGHEHIAPGRKTDPGPAFDWLRLGIDPGAGPLGA